MRVKKIVIRNFAPFYKEHEIEFSNDGRGIHIIRGNTGQGKTSIQQAILWCLYGKILDRGGKEIPPTSLLNRTAKRDGIYQFYVKMFLEHESKDWSIIREMSARRHTDKSYKEGGKFSVVREGEVQSNPELVIQRILPQEVSRFFFFDGEMLRDYEELLEDDSSSIKILRDSIERILGIPYLRIARDDINHVKKRLESERNHLLKRLGGKEVEELAEELNETSNKIDECEELIKKLIEQKESLEVKIKQKKRRQEDIKEIRDFALKRNELEGDAKTLKERKERYMDRQKEIVSNLYKNFLINVAKNIIEKLDKEHEKVMSKYNKKQKLIDQLEGLEKTKKTCKCELCGTVLDEKKLDEIEKKLKEIKLKIEELTEIPEPNLQFDQHATRLKKMTSSQMTNKDELSKLQEDISDIEYDVARLESEINDLNAKLAGIDDEEPMRIQKDIEKMERELGRMESDIKQTEDKRRDYLTKKSEIEQKLRSVPSDELELLHKKIELTEKIYNIFDHAISTYREGRRGEVEKEATEIFKRIRSKASFQELKINDNYGLSILTNTGELLNKSEWRSAGEEQVVALSLVGALNKCANISAPVFMDTPFGRLDTQHVKNVLSYIPEMSEQVVLLVTDREFRKDDEGIIYEKIKTDLTVTHKGEEEGSYITKT